MPSHAKTQLLPSLPPFDKLRAQGRVPPTTRSIALRSNPLGADRKAVGRVVPARGEGKTRCAPSPLAGEGWGEGAVELMQHRHVHIGNLTLGNDRPVVLIAGPCALESRAHALEMSHALVELSAKLGLGLIYKTSFDKANRTSIDSARGMGIAA